jgi:hypothetical protein
MGLDYRETYRSLMQLEPPIVRLAVYWNRSEPEPGTYDFSAVDWMIANTPACTRVVLVVGMKAPRWPEFYIPARLEQANDMPNKARVSDDRQLEQTVIEFVDAVVRHYRDSTAIAYWQVENEPLDPAGPHLWTISADLLIKEIAKVRMLDNQHRPVLVNTFVSTDPLHQVPRLDDIAVRIQTISRVADIVGLDVYPVRALGIFGNTLFVRWPAFVWQRRLDSILGSVRAAGKQVWISELEAEPWLLRERIYLQRLPNPEIFPADTKFILSEIRGDRFLDVLLWGAEFWYLRRQRFGDDRWWSIAEQLVT